MNNLLTDSFELPRRDSSRDADIEMGMHQADASDNLKDFLKKVDAIESLIAKLTNLLNKLQTANEESKAVTKASSMKAIKQRMEKDIDEVGKIARQAKTKVDELEKDNLSNRQKPGCGKGSAVDRSREQTTGAVKKKLKERMDDFQTLREAIRQEYREVDEETIDYLIETGKSEQIFKDAIQHQGRGQERHDAVRDLERKLLELQQIFMDMAVLVEAQGDMINIIETHDSFELPWRDSSRDADIEMGMHQADASDNLKDFLKKVDAIESLIAKLTNLLNKLQTANEEPKAVTKASSMKAIKQRMEKDIDEVGKIARQAKTKVDELEKDNLSNRQKPGCGKGSAVDRSREQTTGAVKKKLKERMDGFQIFMDMLVLVEAQGDMINNIETHVSNATNHIQHGVTALQNAKKLPKNSRKWMSCCW